MRLCGGHGLVVDVKKGNDLQLFEQISIGFYVFILSNK